MNPLAPILDQAFLVSELSLPPNVQAEVENHCRLKHIPPSDRETIEEDFKLSHHFAGRTVIATSGPRGLQIHAVDLDDPDELHRLRQALRAQGHRQVLSLSPTSWREANEAIQTPIPRS